ncbi:MAG: class I SAM-dependent methyltransferase [Bryobacteraceae bacterium]
MLQPDPSPVLDLIEAFRRSKTMFTAVRLGLFDLLEESPASAAELAARTGAHAGALERLLEGCAALGLLFRSADGTFSNTDVARAYLVRSSPATLAGYIRYSDEALYRLWGELEAAVRGGSPRWQQVFGVRGALFDHFYRTPEARADFLSGMHGLGLLSSPAVVRAFNLNGYDSLVDLGGATGHLAIAACERYGRMRAIVFDLPEVIEFARPHIEVSRARDRISTTAGDFFRDPLPPASLYALGRILHDWSDSRCLELLRRVRAALLPGGAVLIAEKLLDEDRCGPPDAAMQSLNMLVCTEGRERTESEYRALLEAAGFGDVEARRTGAPLDALLARTKQ